MSIPVKWIVAVKLSHIESCFIIEYADEIKDFAARTRFEIAYSRCAIPWTISISGLNAVQFVPDLRLE